MIDGSTSRGGSRVRAASGRIVVHCSGCGEPIRHGAGWVEVNLVAVGEHERKRREYERTRYERTQVAGVRLTRLSDIPDDLIWPVPWKAWHRACDPDIEAQSYYIDVERIATWPQVVEWCAHLAEKSWIGSTGWWGEMQSLVHGGDGILRAAGGG